MGEGAESRPAAVSLPGTKDVGAPIVSPDGQWIAFSQGGQVKKMPIGGGAPVTIADSSFDAPLAWLDDGTLVYTGLRGRPVLRRARESGGASSVLWSSPDSQPNIGPFFPAPLPGARGVLFTLCSGLCATSELWVVDLKSGSAKQLLPDALKGAGILPTGHLVFVRRNGGMFAGPRSTSRRWRFAEAQFPSSRTSRSCSGSSRMPRSAPPGRW